MPYRYDYPHPAVAVDIVVFTIDDADLKVLLIRRRGPPFAGGWALPGGFVGIDESLKRAAWRELREETGVSAGILEQLHTFGHPQRDPRERVISVAYLAPVPADRLRPEPASDAREARLFSVSDLPLLAFDHAKILRLARERLRQKLEKSVLPLELMGASFTLTELQRACELILGVTLDKRNFHKKVHIMDVIEATGEEWREGQHRPAKLYRVKSRRDLTDR